MKKLILAAVFFPGLALAQQAPQAASPQGQMFACQQQLSLLQSQDGDVLGRAYDLVQQDQAVSEQVTALQKQVQSLNAEIAALKQRPGVKKH